MFLPKNTKVKIYLNNKTFVQGKIDRIKPDYLRVIKEDGQYSVILNPAQNVFLIDQLEEESKMSQLPQSAKPILEKLEFPPPPPNPDIYKDIDPPPYIRDPALRAKKLTDLHISRKKAELENAKTLLSSNKLATIQEVNYGVPGFFRKQ
jgi:hypothetical protein